MSTTVTVQAPSPSALPRRLSAARRCVQLPAAPNTAALRKPKLSLNTAPATRTFGRGNTGLTLETTATSPTRRNTFHNAYEASSPAAGPRSPARYYGDALDTARPSTASSASSLDSSSSTTDDSLPYVLPPTAKSILRNTRAAHPPPTAYYTPATSTSLFFPAPKHVSFSSTPEEICTRRYTAAHSDLLSEAEWTSRGTKERAPRLAVAPVHIGGKRPSPIDEDSTDDDNSTAEAKTPSASRSKRRREWVWTLEPLEGMDVDGGVRSAGRCDAPP